MGAPLISSLIMLGVTQILPRLVGLRRGRTKKLPDGELKPIYHPLS